jgi:hypothetical protein
MEKLYKWQERHLARIKLLSNEELLEEVLDSAGGDDYDGCWTNRGWWEYQVMKEELESRLKVFGFLGE